MKEVVYIVTALTALLVGGAVVWRILSKKSKDVLIEEVDSLSLKDVIRFFAEEQSMHKLKEREDLIAVAMREQLDVEFPMITICLYDTKKNCVVEILKHLKVRKLDSSLQDAFGDKDMIVLK